MSAEKIQEKLEAEAEAMWQKGELTTEELFASRHFMRRFVELLKGAEKGKGKD